VPAGRIEFHKGGVCSVSELHGWLWIHHVILGGNNDQKRRTHIGRSLFQGQGVFAGYIQRNDGLPLTDLVARSSAVRSGVFLQPRKGAEQIV
jgi:hypothetical protein